MKLLSMAVGALFLAAGSACADPYAAMYGNTLQVTGADGTKSTAYINQDMTYEQHLSDGTVIKGTYAWKDAQTACFTQTDPPPRSPDAATACFSGQGDHRVGDTWTVTGSDGKPSTLSLIAGQ